LPAMASLPKIDEVELADEIDDTIRSADPPTHQYERLAQVIKRVNDRKLEE
jgi:hypothetical protein